MLTSDQDILEALQREFNKKDTKLIDGGHKDGVEGLNGDTQTAVIELLA